MADITLHRDNEFQKTIVPNYFIDAYMIHANGEYVKIYLYLLRCMCDPSMSFSISDFADKFDHTEKDIIRALKYWEKMHLLRLEFDDNKELTGICFLDAANVPAASEVPAVQVLVEKPDTTPAIPARKNYSAAELSRLREEGDIQVLLFVAEHYIGHTLNATEINAIIYWKESLNLSSDLIDYLIESCVSKNHKSVHYMEKIALSWAKKGISTIDEAKAESSEYNELHGAIRRSFGISGRDFVPYEQEYIAIWQRDYGFQTEIIAAACERTIRAIHQVSFEYADSILKNWKKNNVSTLQDVDALDSLHQEAKNKAGKPSDDTDSAKPKSGTKFSNFEQRTYTNLEKELSYGFNK